MLHRTASRVAFVGVHPDERAATTVRFMRDALAGVAPIPASSGQRRRMRLNRGGNRQLNRALFTIAMVQLRHYPPAQTYVTRKRSEGKSSREAIRCLKRHLARVVFHALRRGVSGGNDN